MQTAKIKIAASPQILVMLPIQDSFFLSALGVSLNALR
jgi:hypothetical protein